MHVSPLGKEGKKEKTSRPDGGLKVLEDVGSRFRSDHQKDCSVLMLWVVKVVKGALINWPYPKVRDKVR